MIAFALQAAAAFNLVCTGTYTTEPSYPPLRGSPTAEAPFTITCRIDLEQARYCADPCESIEPLAEVTDAWIMLKNTSILSGLEDGTVIGVNRRTWQYGARAVGVNTVRHVGQCERAPFTGFPASPR